MSRERSPSSRNVSVSRERENRRVASSIPVGLPPENVRFVREWSFHHFVRERVESLLVSLCSRRESRENL